MKNIIKSLIIICGSLLATNGFGQKTYNNLKSYDLSKLWCAEKLNIIDGDVKSIDFPEPIGFIGDNYQRFYIHYTSVTKDVSNPNKYNVKGKTRVKNNICSFIGTITVTNVKTYKSHESHFKTGIITCLVDLQEDKKQKESGTIKGKMETYFCIDRHQKLQYNTIDAVADGFNNNQCEAIWTSYETHKSKKCNWGDFRIPNSGDLDTGTGEFMVREKYIQNGWYSFVKSSDNIPQNKKSIEEENRKWWL